MAKKELGLLGILDLSASTRRFMRVQGLEENRVLVITPREMERFPLFKCLQM